MTRSRILFFFSSSLIVLLLVGGNMLGAADEPPEDSDSLYKYLSVFTEVLSVVREAYVEEIDVDTLMAGALDGATEALDPFSVYLPAGKAEGYLALREGAYRLSGLLVLKDRGIAFVAAVVPGGPGAEAGIKMGDVIARINERSSRLMPMWQVYEFLGKEPGRTVDLEILRSGERETRSFVLAPTELPRVTLEWVEQVPVLRVGRMDPRTVDEVRSQLADLGKRGEEKLVLDLRRLAGGDPQVAYDLAALFVQGKLGSLRDRDEEVQAYDSEAEPVWNGRLALLVSRSTLGAAEILATILRQAGEADLVGERTFGYAGRQSFTELPTGAKLLITDAFFAGPDDEPLRQGLKPDVEVSERSRGPGEEEMSLEDLTLRRGVRHLIEPPASPEEEPLPEAA
jgi:carboxyl-terminal processing protease